MYVYIICECVRYLMYTHILPYRNKKLFVQKNVTVKKKNHFSAIVTTKHYGAASRKVKMTVPS